MTESDDPDRPTIAPFLGAFVVFVLVVIAIFVVNALSGSDPSPEAQVRDAIAGQNQALQKQDYRAFRTYTCRAAQGTEAAVLAGQRDSVAKNGERFVDTVAGVRIDGDVATAKVTYFFQRAEDVKTTADVALTREDGAWKVCPR